MAFEIGAVVFAACAAIFSYFVRRSAERAAAAAEPLLFPEKELKETSTGMQFRSEKAA